MYDFIIIGGGIVGMSTAMHLIKVYPDAKILLLEKESGPARHQTGHNSGVIHAGVYYTPGSLKARFCLEGNKATKAFCTQHGIPFDECGKLLVATNELEMQRMKRCGSVPRPTAGAPLAVGRRTARARANIVGMGGIFVPSSGIVNYAKVTAAMGAEFQRAGGEIRYGAEVVACRSRPAK